MGCGVVSSVFLGLLNVAQVGVAAAMMALSVLFYLEVGSVTALRNQNRYTLDFEPHWPLVAPWLFLAVGALALLVSCCGLAGASRRSRALLVVYGVFQALSLAALVVAAAVTLVYADSVSTDQFVSASVFDAFQNRASSARVSSAYGDIERKYLCCGAAGPQDYISTGFPVSCCEPAAEGGAVSVCRSTDQMANARTGCVAVATVYTRRALRALAGGSVLAAALGLLGLIFSVTLYFHTQRKPALSPHDVDTLKLKPEVLDTVKIKK